MAAAAAEQTPARLLPAAPRVILLSRHNMKTITTHCQRNRLRSGGGGSGGSGSGVVAMKGEQER